MASPQQQSSEHSAISGFKALMGGFASMGNKAHAIAGEFAKMSEETLGVGVKAAERLHDARSFEEVTTIQSEMLKESYEATTNHYRKIAELAMSTTTDLGASVRELASTMAQAGQESADRIAETARKMGGQAEDATETASAQAEPAMRGGRG